jgi:hypothetical protein
MTRPPLFCAVVCACLLAIPPVVLSARAITVAEILQEAVTTNATSYTTGAFALASGEVGVCVAANSDADTPEEWSSFTHNSVTWDIRGTSANATERVTYFTKVGPQASSTAVLDTGGADAQQGLITKCFAVTGADTTTPFLQIKGTTTSATPTHTVTFDNARASGSVVFSTYQSSNLNGTVPFTPEYANSNAANVLSTEHGTPDRQSRTQWVIGGADTNPTWTTGGNQATRLLAIEIAEGAAAGATVKSLLLLGIGDSW